MVLSVVDFKSGAAGHGRVLKIRPGPVGQPTVLNIIASTGTERFPDIAIGRHGRADIRSKVGIQFGVFDVPTDAGTQRGILDFHPRRR